MKITKYWRVWIQLTKCSFGSYAAAVIDAITYFTGKVVRFTFFYLTISALFHYTKSFAGYTRYEALLFFITFYLVETVAQALFRGIYLFVRDVNNGNFDLTLVKPINPLFFSLTRKTDLLDTIIITPTVLLLIYTIYNLPSAVTMRDVMLYVALFSLGLVINTGIHIFAATASLWTLGGENVIWVYRRLILICNFPPDILPSIWQIFFIYIFPVFMMTAFPAKALLHLLHPIHYLLAVMVAAFFFGGSLVVWKLSLKHYASASS